MNYLLNNEKGEAFYVNFYAWPELLNLAKLYGWQPQGTELREVNVQGNEGEFIGFENPDAINEWDETDYHSNSHQWVTEADAAGMVDALERALRFVPDRRTAPDLIRYADKAVTDEALLELAEEHQVFADALKPRPKNARNQLRVSSEALRYFPGALEDVEKVTVMRVSDWYPGMEAPTVIVVEPGQSFEILPLDFFSGRQQKQSLSAFIEFCRGGAFCID